MFNAIDRNNHGVSIRRIRVGKRRLEHGIQNSQVSDMSVGTGTGSFVDITADGPFGLRRGGKIDE
jgi:hypothetical protein